MADRKTAPRKQTLTTVLVQHMSDEAAWQKDVSVQLGGLPALSAWQEHYGPKIDRLAVDLHKVMEIKINGTEPREGEFPLQTSLRGLHDNVRQEAVRIKFWKTFADWRAQNSFFRVLRTKSGRWLVAIVVTSAAQYLAAHFHWIW